MVVTRHDLVRALLLLLMTGVFSPAWALDLNQQVAFKIAPQKLSTALIEFSHQAKVQIAVGKDLGERDSEGLTGTYAIGETLSRLLAPSGFGYQVINGTSISIGAPGRIGLNGTTSDGSSGQSTPTAASAATLSSPADDSAEVGTQIQEVVVTATKREESVRNIPESISVFSGAELEDQGKTDLNDFIEQSPGVTASQGVPGNTRVTMRGISTDTNPYSSNASPVGIFIGDTAFTDPYIQNIVPDLCAFDLANVEVLKGPQGTLFGGAALAGAVRYVLNEPALGEWELRGFSQLDHPSGGSYAWTSGAAINIPLLKEDNLAFRFDYIDRHYPGVYTDSRTGARDVDRGSGNQVRAALLWEPSREWKLELTHISQASDLPWGFILAQSPDGPRQTDDDVVPQPSQNSFDLNSLELGYNFGSMRLTSLSSFTSKNSTLVEDETAALIGTPPSMYPPAAAALNTVTDKSEAFAQELRLQSTGHGPFEWLLGAYFYNYHMHYNLNLGFPLVQGLDGPGSLIGDVVSALGLPSSVLSQYTNLLYATSNAKSQERALFGDLSYRPWDQLELSAGARFYSTETNGGFTGSGLLVLAENDLMNANTVAKIAEQGINPKFSATYHFDDDISLYGLAAKGFRFGGIQGVPSTSTNHVPPTFNSDSLWNYELGLRTSWLDNSLHADITGYDLRYKNPIIAQATQGIPLSYNSNVSSAVSLGLEASLLWKPPVRGLSLSFNGALTNAHITSAFTAANGKLVEPGQEMPGASRIQYSTSIQYLRPVWLLNAGGHIGYTYVGKGYNDLTHDAQINGFGNLEAGLIFSGDASGFDPKLTVNLSNILNVTRATGAPATGTTLLTDKPLDLYTLTPPRSVSIRLSFDF